MRSSTIGVISTRLVSAVEVSSMVFSSISYLVISLNPAREVLIRLFYRGDNRVFELVSLIIR